MSSSPPAIEVHGLGKRYVIGDGPRFDSMGMHQMLEDFVRAPMRFFGPRDSNARSPREDLWALRDVSLQVQAGETLGLVGHNGAGKSVLLKILSRVTRPTEGHAVVRGRVGALLEISAGFHTELTGRENIFLSGAILGMPQAQIVRHFDDIVEFAGIGKQLDTPVKRYSSGMSARLGFSVAAHLDADILLVDEVLAVGDEGFRQQCIEKMRSLAAGGRTIIFVSHDLPSLEDLCDRTLLLNQGRAVAVGPTSEILVQYSAQTGQERTGESRPQRP